MNKYETLYIVRPDLEEEAYKAEIEKFSQIVLAQGGVIANVDEWGKRKMAYDILDFKDGAYVVMTYDAPPTTPAELERNMKNADSILRYMTIRLDG